MAKDDAENRGNACRVERLLAQLLAHFLDAEYTQRGKIAVLSRCGMSHDDIALLLGTSPATVKQSVYEVKSGKAGLRKTAEDTLSRGARVSKRKQTRRRSR